MSATAVSKLDRRTLVRAGLAVATPGVVQAGVRTLGVVRLTITEMGRGTVGAQGETVEVSTPHRPSQDRAGAAGVGAPFVRAGIPPGEVSGGSPGLARWPWAVRLDYWRWLLDGASRQAGAAAAPQKPDPAGRPGWFPPWAKGLNRYRDSAHFEVGSQLIGQP
jgi:hypothetical protein